MSRPRAIVERCNFGGSNSIYGIFTKQAPYTFECLKNLKGGKALFTNPHTLVKCGGAPLKILFLAADYFRKHGVADKTEIQYWSGGTRFFGVEKYEKSLLKVVERYSIKMNFFFKLDEIDGPNKRAKFTGIDEKNKGEEQWVDFEMMHVSHRKAPLILLETACLPMKSDGLT